MAISITEGVERVSRSGLEIAKGVRSTDPMEARGNEYLRQLASHMIGKEGDGSKLAALMASHLSRSCSEAIAAGHAPADVFRGVDDATSAAKDYLGHLVVPAAGRLQAIARSAACDSSVGQKIAEALSLAGRDGVVNVEESPGDGLTVSTSEALTFDRGYITPDFASQAPQMEVHLTDAYVLLYLERISAFREILNVLEKVALTGRPLLVIADDVEGEALATLILNTNQGRLQSVAIKTPGFGDRKKETLRDLAVFTGARLIDPILGPSLSRVNLDDLGRAARVVVSSDQTSILGGAGSEEDLEARASHIRAQIETTTSDYTREKLTERLANLRGKVVTIKVGGPTPIDTAERRRRTIASMYASLSSLKTGAVPGGGTALFWAGQQILNMPSPEPAVQLGRESVGLALQEPLRQLVRNANADESQVIDSLLAGSRDTFGFNAIGSRVTNTAASEIYDSLSVTMSALDLAVSAARQVVLTGALEEGKLDIGQQVFGTSDPEPIDQQDDEDTQG